MPPPKKPKSGPTRAEEFLSDSEIDFEEPWPSALDSMKSENATKSGSEMDTDDSRSNVIVDNGNPAILVKSEASQKLVVKVENASSTTQNVGDRLENDTTGSLDLLSEVAALHQTNCVGQPKLNFQGAFSLGNISAQEARSDKQSVKVLRYDNVARPQIELCDKDLAGQALHNLLNERNCYSLRDLSQTVQEIERKNHFNVLRKLLTSEEELSLKANKVANLHTDGLSRPLLHHLLQQRMCAKRQAEAEKYSASSPRPKFGLFPESSIEDSSDSEKMHSITHSILSSRPIPIPRKYEVLRMESPPSDCSRHAESTEFRTSPDNRLVGNSESDVSSLPVSSYLNLGTPSSIAHSLPLSKLPYSRVPGFAVAAQIPFSHLYAMASSLPSTGKPHFPSPQNPQLSSQVNPRLSSQLNPRLSSSVDPRLPSSSTSSGEELICECHNTMHRASSDSLAFCKLHRNQINKRLSPPLEGHHRKRIRVMSENSTVDVDDGSNITTYYLNSFDDLQLPLRVVHTAPEPLDTIAQNLSAPTDSTQSTVELPSSTVDGRARKNGLEGDRSRDCNICKDRASGQHYGVWSCEGCKAFFKRSIQGPVDYVCPASNTCTIDKTRRRCCQACRFRRCIESGMTKGTARAPRTARSLGSGKTTNKRKLESVDSNTGAEHSNAGPSNYDQHPTAAGSSLPPGSMVRRDPEAMRFLKEELLKPLACQPVEQAPMPIDPLVECLLRIEPAQRSAIFNGFSPDTQEGLVIALLSLTEAELLDTISWAKSIPGYTDLGLSEQVQLLECCWMEILLLSLCWRSLETLGRPLIYAPDLHVDSARSQMLGQENLSNSLALLTTRLAELQLKQEEFVLLKALVLFNADLRLGETCSQVRQLEQQALSALQYTLQRLQQNPLRLASLMAPLPHLRQLSQAAIVSVASLTARGLPANCDLLNEMLSVHVSANPSLSQSF